MANIIYLIFLSFMLTACGGSEFTTIDRQNTGGSGSVEGNATGGHLGLSTGGSKNNGSGGSSGSTGAVPGTGGSAGSGGGSPETGGSTATGGSPNTGGMTAATGGAGSATGGTSGSGGGGGSGGGVTCSPPLLLCGSTCIDPQTNTKNCGTCGHICDGACTEGKCDPVLVVSFDEATSTFLPGSLAASETEIFASGTGGGLVRIPFGSAPQVISKPTVGGSSGSGVGFNAAYVYWPLSGSITQAPVNANAGDPIGPNVTTLNPGPISMATDASNVYWIDRLTGAFYKASLFGTFPTTATQITTGLETPDGQIAVDATNVYWIGGTTSETLFSMPLTGGTVTPILALPNKDGRSVAVDANNIYWTETGTGPQFGNLPGGVMKMPLAGGTPTTLISGQKNADNLALNNTHVFWTAYVPGPPSNPLGTMNIMSLPKSGQ